METFTISLSSLAILMSAMTILVGLATTYLRFFTRNMIMDMQKALEEKLESKFSSKETIELKLQVFQAKLDHIERAVERLEKNSVK